jgi:hypothetical protein
MSPGDPLSGSVLRTTRSCSSACARATKHDPAGAASVVPLVGAGWLDVDEIARVHHLMCLRLSPEKKIITRSHEAKRNEADRVRRAAGLWPSPPRDLAAPDGRRPHNRQAAGLGPYQPPWASHPPSTAMVVPVMNDASSLARNATAVAISRGSAYRPIGVRRTMSSEE